MSDWTTAIAFPDDEPPKPRKPKLTPAVIMCPVGPHATKIHYDMSLDDEIIWLNCDHPECLALLRVKRMGDNVQVDVI